MYMCVRSIEKDVQCLPVLLSTLFFRTKSLSKLGTWHSAGWSQMCIAMAHNWDLNLGAHVLTASPVPTELLLRSLTFYQLVTYTNRKWSLKIEFSNKIHVKMIVCRSRFEDLFWVFTLRVVYVRVCACNLCVYKYLQRPEEVARYSGIDDDRQLKGTWEWTWVLR